MKTSKSQIYVLKKNWNFLLNGAMSDLVPKVVKILSIKEKQWLDSDTNPVFV